MANMSLSEALAEVVRALRQNRKMTQDDLTLIGRRERDKTNVTMEILSKVASTLEVDPALLLLLAHSAQSGEVALKRISFKLDDLTQDGALDAITTQPARRTGRPATPDVQKALERAPL